MHTLWQIQSVTYLTNFPDDLVRTNEPDRKFPNLAEYVLSFLCSNFQIDPISYLKGYLSSFDWSAYFF